MPCDQSQAIADALRVFDESQPDVIYKARGQSPLCADQPHAETVVPQVSQAAAGNSHERVRKNTAQPIAESMLASTHASTSMAPSDDDNVGAC